MKMLHNLVGETWRRNTLRGRAFRDDHGKSCDTEIPWSSREVVAVCSDLLGLVLECQLYRREYLVRVTLSDALSLCVVEFKPPGEYIQ